MGSRPNASGTHRGAVRSGHPAAGHLGSGHHPHATSPTHRALHPRYGRVLAVFLAATVTVVSLLGALGVLGAAEPTASATSRDPSAGQPVSTVAYLEPGTAAQVAVTPLRSAEAAAAPAPAELPSGSGTGRRVVFSIGEQRVWLVGPSGRAVRTYLVSGSLTDNLRPGTFEVYSTSRHAVGIDDSGTMEYMVRFAHGKRAAIGFHDIPVHEGELVQSISDLGTPQSHGCIRQRHSDARALWDFAPVGTTVVVTA